jgi:hypothetical protein
MKLSTSIPFLLALLATPIAAQSAAILKKDLRQKETAAKKDPDAIYEVGNWAKEHKLEKDAVRLYTKVLKIAADHAGANLALGNELVEGKWLPAKEAKKLRDKVLEAEFSAKGFKKIDDIWVEESEVEDARQGIFHHDGQTVSRDEKIALQAGKVRHPMTGGLLPVAGRQMGRSKGSQPVPQRDLATMADPHPKCADHEHPANRED